MKNCGRNLLRNAEKMKKPELLAPAGSLEGVRAAVQSGADAVYMGFGTFNARRGAKNFTREQMIEAIAYCRARGVKTNITFNIVALDREMEQAIADIKLLNQAGADALIVQDIGLAQLIRTCAPEMPIHASTQMTVHTLDGARFVKSLGFSRVVLSRECTLEEIREIAAGAGIETEVFVHGALCMCYSGQCYLSSVIGQRSGNRGLCAQPCRLPYGYEGKSGTAFPLSLKDLCLAGWLQPLVQAGVASFKIEGRMKRPEYAAVVTDIYSRLLREQRRPTKEEMDTLQLVFSRDGFTDGYFTGKKGDTMFGTKTDVPLDKAKPLYEQAARRFAEGREMPRVPVDMAFTARTGQPVSLAVCDGEHALQITGEIPETAVNRPITEEIIAKSLQKTGGTPFIAQKIGVGLDAGLMVPASHINALRRQALTQLLQRREQPPARVWHEPTFQREKQLVQPFQGYTVEVRTMAQITREMCSMPPQMIYVPLDVLANHQNRTQQLLAQGLTLCAVLPRVYNHKEQKALSDMLCQVKQMGITHALAGNLGQIETLRRFGMETYGDFGLNVCNSGALAVLAGQGIRRQTLSFELRLPQLRDLCKPIDTELIVYGYLPLMLFENCAIRRKTGKCTCKTGITALTDRTGRRMALLPEYGCRNTLLNSQPLYLAEPEFAQLGIPYARLRFTIEAPKRCGQIYTAYMQRETPVFPEGHTRGLYRRGVE